MKFIEKGISKVVSWIIIAIIILICLYLVTAALNWVAGAFVGFVERQFSAPRPTTVSVPAPAERPRVGVTPPAQKSVRPASAPRANKKPQPKPAPTSEATSRVEPQRDMSSAWQAPGRTRVLVKYECSFLFLNGSAFPVVQSEVEQALLRAGAEVYVARTGRDMPPPFDIALTVKIRDIPANPAPNGFGSPPQHAAHVTISAMRGGVIYAQSIGQKFFYASGCTACDTYAFGGYAQAAHQAIEQIIGQLALKSSGRAQNGGNYD